MLSLFQDQTTMLVVQVNCSVLCLNTPVSPSVPEMEGINYMLPGASFLKLQALVYDILPSEKRCSECDPFCESVWPNGKALG